MFEIYWTAVADELSLPMQWQRIKDAIATHNTPRCSIGPTLGVGNLLESATPQASRS